MNSLTKENYLKALFHLANSENEISVKDLSDNLGIRMPSVNSMMKKFSTEGWVIYESYKPLILTEKGRRKAALIVRKHRLTEMFLVEKMGFGWEEVHDIAEEIEHIQSPVFFDKIDEILNFPKQILMALLFRTRKEISLKTTILNLVNVRLENL